MKCTLFATPNSNGKWVLTRADGTEVHVGYEYPTREAVLEVAARLWPSDSAWHGKKVRSGWQIEIEPEVKK